VPRHGQHFDVAPRKHLGDLLALAPIQTWRPQTSLTDSGKAWSRSKARGERRRYGKEQDKRFYTLE
jgi:hypothetical protein